MAVLATSITPANAARYPRYDQSTVPKTTIPRPRSAENETGLTLAIACIHAGKLARGRSAPLANMSGSPAKRTPKTRAARIITGIWMSPRLVDPRTLVQYTVALLVGVSKMRFINPKRLSWIVLIDPN